MNNIQKLSKLKNDILNQKGLNSTERNRKNQIVKTISNIETQVNNLKSKTALQPQEKILLSELEVQATHIKKAIGQKGAKSLLKSSSGYQSFKVGQANAKERETITSKMVKEATVGSDEYFIKEINQKVNKTTNMQKYLNSNKNLKHLTNQEKGVLIDLATRKGFKIGNFNNEQAVRDIIYKSFEDEFFNGPMAVFKNFKGEFTRDGNGNITYFEDKINELKELMQNDPNFINNYAKFHTEFFEKILPAMYEKMKQKHNYIEGQKATAADMMDALEKGIQQYKKYNKKKMKRVKKKRGKRRR